MTDIRSQPRTRNARNSVLHSQKAKKSLEDSRDTHSRHKTRRRLTAVTIFGRVRAKNVFRQTHLGQSRSSRETASLAAAEFFACGGEEFRACGTCLPKGSASARLWKNCCVTYIAVVPVCSWNYDRELGVGRPWRSDVSDVFRVYARQHCQSIGGSGACLGAFLRVCSLKFLHVVIGE